MKPDFDAIIFGSGFAAWTCASVLCKLGKTIAVLTRAGRIRPIGEHLPSEGLQAMHSLGLGQFLQSPSHRICPGILSLWSGNRTERQNSIMRPGGQALHLDRRLVESELKCHAIKAGAKQMVIRQMPSIVHSGGVWKLEFGADQAINRVSANIIVDATGRNAALARKLGARISRDDGLIGIAAFITNLALADATFCIEAMPRGWLYYYSIIQVKLVLIVRVNISFVKPNMVPD